MLTEILDKVVKRLQSTDRLRGVDILHEEEQSIQDKFRKSFGPKGDGSMILVKFGRMSSDSPDAPGPHLDTAKIEVVHYESPVLNRGKDRLTALQLAEISADVLHYPNHPQETLLQELGTVCTGLATGSAKNMLLWTAYFDLSVTLQPEVSL